MLRSTGAPLDLSSDSALGGAPGALERWKIPLTVAGLAVAIIGAAWWLVKTPVAQPIALPTPAAETARQVKVHITGAVAKPGLYAFASGLRRQDAIDQAGGPSPDADLGRVNLAQRLRDGEQVVIPSVQAAASPPPFSAQTRPSGIPATTRVNLNRATLAELDALPGIGPTTAKRILDHREKIGPFAAPDDLRKARLVTSRTWDQVKDRIEAP